MPVVPFARGHLEDRSMVEMAPKPGEKVRLDPGEDAPEGHPVQHGPRGGRFYIFQGENQAYFDWQKRRGRRWAQERREREARPAAPAHQWRAPRWSDEERREAPGEERPEAPRPRGFQRVRPREGTWIRLDPGEMAPNRARVRRGAGGGMAFQFAEDLGADYEEWKDRRDRRRGREARERAERRRAREAGRGPARGRIPQGQPMRVGDVGGGENRRDAAAFLQWMGLPNNRMGYLGEGDAPGRRLPAEDVALDVMRGLWRRYALEKMPRGGLHNMMRDHGIRAMVNQLADDMGRNRWAAQANIRGNNPGMPDPLDLWGANAPEPSGPRRVHECGSGMHRHDDYREGECHPEDQRHGALPAAPDDEEAGRRVAAARADLEEAGRARDELKRQRPRFEDEVKRAAADVEHQEGRLARHQKEYVEGREGIEVFNRYVGYLTESVAKIAEHKRLLADLDSKIAEQDRRVRLAQRVIDRQGVAPARGGGGVLGPDLTDDDLASPLLTMREAGAGGGIHGASTWQVNVPGGLFESHAGLSDAKAVYKVTSGYRGVSEAPNEVASFLTSDLLGWDMVPEVRRADLAGKGPGHVMRWVDKFGSPGATAHMAVSDSRLDTPGLVQSYVRMRALDILLGNSDRHGGNWFIDRAEDRIWAIDNGYTFAHNGGIPGHDYRPDNLYNSLRLQVREDQWDMARDLVDGLKDDVRARRDDLLAMCEREVSKEQADQFGSRIEAFLGQELR